MRKFISLLILFCALSCSKTEHSYFPIWKVSLELDLTFEDKELNGIGNYKTYIRGKTPGIGAMEYTGLGGILVRCNGINEYRAYDLACPYEKNATVRIEVDELGISAICPKCGSTFNLVDGPGILIQGPADRGLKQYQTALSGTKLYVTN